MLLSRTTRTLYGEARLGVLTIDDGLQQQVEADSSTLVGLFASDARTFETSTKRWTGETALEYIATPELTFRGSVRRINRDGDIPYGGSFGHGSLVELPAPVEHTLTDVDAGAEFARDWLLLRGGFTGSLFHNETTTLTFDSPFRLVDATNAPSRGRSSLPPSNTYVTVNGMASARMPYRSRATAYVSVGSLKDAGDPLMPQTINTANDPDALSRQFVDGEARTTSVDLSFTTRPTRLVGLDLRLRTYEYDNQTPQLVLTQRVSYDNRPSDLSEPIHTEAYGVERQSFEANLNVTPRSRMSTGVGFSALVEDRSHRIFESTTDYGTRLWFDTVGNEHFTLRTKYEHRRRRTDANLAEVAETLLAIGEQPGMRHYDIAERDRDRFTVTGAVFPSDMLVLNLSVGVGKDDYLASQFGLRDNTHRVLGGGVDVSPTERLSYGASYTFERYNALSRSRQANPGAQFDDPARNWATDATDRVHSFLLNVGAEELAGRVDLNVAYDFSRARSTYEYIAGAVPDRTLPEEVIVDTVLPAPDQLPPTLNELHRATTDVIVSISERVSVGLSHWFERYRVEDFTLDADANQELVRGNVLLFGYLYRPYTANTFWGRLIYTW
jgi:MtrB/PioB family decaheme-associated outer membrane protein